ncbi:hypothetical protein X749_01025 [Mesorhizobium sp. LNJC391B00]|nr:hypothetical protein X749_01025 [Mesorhizobium sp. LNJC391B00]
MVERVNPDKAAANAGLQPGDVIVAVDQSPVRNARQANQGSPRPADRAGSRCCFWSIAATRKSSSPYPSPPVETSWQARRTTDRPAARRRQNSCCPLRHLREHYGRPAMAC